MEDFDQKFFISTRPKSLKEHAKTCIKNNKFEVSKWFPPIEWLPKYQPKYLFTDIIAGITISLLSIPQGMAYASLAGIPPVIGLYSSFLPPLLYVFLGSSKHNVLGLIAVICMMVGSTQQKLGIDIKNSTRIVSGVDLWSIESVRNVSTLSLMVGIIFAVMFLCQLHHVTIYLSDQVTRAFITGSAVHILWSQIPTLFGIRSTQAFTGFLKLYYTIKDFFEHINGINYEDTILSLVCIIILFSGNYYINPWINTKFFVPFPFELLLVVVTTILSNYMNFHSKYGMEIVNHIPTGFPKFHVPRIDMRLWIDSIILAFVVFCVVYSGEKVIAKKHNYKISPRTELRALSIVYVISSFFMCAPACGGLVRIAVSSNMGSKSQITGLACSLIILILVLWLGPLIETLPMCVLSSIIVVALKNMLLQVMDVLELWKTSKIDMAIWIFTFVITVVWDVTEGLIGSIGFSLLTVILRIQCTKSSTLEQVDNFEIYAPKESYRSNTTLYNKCIYRFNGPLLFLNTERFQKNALKCYKAKFSQLYSIKTKKLEVDPCSENYYLIVDASRITDIDQAGVTAIKALNEEIIKLNGVLMIAECSKAVREECHRAGLSNVLLSSSFYPTIQDAIANASLKEAEKRKSDCLCNDKFCEMKKSLNL